MQISENGQLIESSTGEVINDINGITDMIVPAREIKIMQLIEAGGEFIHLEKARELKVPAHVVASYISAPAVVLKDEETKWINKPILIIGGIVYFSGPFTSAKEKDHRGNPLIMEGYYKSLIKIAETYPVRIAVGDIIRTIQRHYVISTSGLRFAQALGMLIEEYGWYGYKKPGVLEPWDVPAIINKDSKGRHLLDIMDPSFFDEEGE